MTSLAEILAILIYPRDWIVEKSVKMVKRIKRILFK